MHSLYGLYEAHEQFESNAAGNRDELSTAELRAERAEVALDEEQQKTTVLTAECAALAEENHALGTQLLGSEFTPARLKFLRCALAACLESVESSLKSAQKKSKRNVDLR